MENHTDAWKIIHKDAGNLLLFRNKKEVLPFIMISLQTAMALFPRKPFKGHPSILKITNFFRKCKLIFFEAFL